MSPKATQHSPSQAVVERVADAENVDPLALDVPLYDAVDPDALDALFDPTVGKPSTTGRVTFEYYGHTVVVASDGTVTLPNERAAPAKPV